ncbi:triose-phosphate isomerase [Parvularcula bermudensis]|nr:triose-phosphate isomerase [Parvularcula bermudensis]
MGDGDVRRLIAGNWKMNGLEDDLAEVTTLAQRLETPRPDNVDVVICPPATLIAPMHALQFDTIGLGAQDCHTEESGAYTGDLSAAMLRDAGACYCIVGHSERRDYHGETDEVVKAKLAAALKADLIPILCVGENLETREAGKAVDTVVAQLKAAFPGAGKGVVVAYEPIWAIGTGKTAGPAEIEEMHAALRQATSPDTRLLYGGSVKPGNAAEILAVSNVNGALVGGASLKADDFEPIVRA